MLKYDCIIAGSGIAGLTAAALLGRRGRRVLILEKKPHPGGALRRFKRRDFSFDVGFHYTGGLGEGEILRLLWDYCHVTQYLQIIPLLEQGCDQLSIIGKKDPVTVAYAYDRFEQELNSHFPDQAKAIGTYFANVKKICTEIPFYNTRLPLTPFLRGYKSRHLLLADYLQKLTGNTDLLAVLASPAFLYGVPASHASLEVHAMVAHGYYSGAYAIRNGGQAIVDAFLAVLQHNGTDLMTRQTVTKIRHEAHHIAVHTESGEQFYCDNLIFTGHPANIVDMVPESAFRPAYCTRLQTLKNTTSMCAVFATIPTNPSSAPAKQINKYLLPSGLNPIPETLSASAGNQSLFMSTPGIWDTAPLRNNRQGVILLSPCPWEEVAAFSDTTRAGRTQLYYNKKESLIQQMIETAQHTWDNCSDIQQLAAGTPLTFRDELSTPQGAVYGAMHCLGQYTPDCRTRMPGVFLAGQSTLMTGVAGASLSGLVCAGEIMGLEQLWDEVRQCE